MTTYHLKKNNFPSTNKYYAVFWKYVTVECTDIFNVNATFARFSADMLFIVFSALFVKSRTRVEKRSDDRVLSALSFMCFAWS